MALAIGAVLVSSPANPCCCPGGDCCLYPWPDPNGEAGGPYYPSTDLPATVVLLGITLTLGADPSAPYDYREAGDPSSNNFVNANFDPTSPVWTRSTQDPPFPSPATSACLIDGTVVVDEFPTSLSVDIAELSIVGMLIDRLTPDTDPCTWYGCQFYEHVDDEDHFLVVTVRYNSTTYKWEAIVEIWNGADCGALSGVISTATQEKSDPQDTPVGSYLGTYTVTVS